LPKTPILSNYKTAPTKLPIEFYNPKWFLNLTDAQQQSIPSTKAVAFLPNVSKSLKPKKHSHPEEKLTNTSFICKYWDILAKPYGLLEESSNTKSEDGEAAGQGGPQNASNSQG
jgi:hypothetical protein